MIRDGRAQMGNKKWIISLILLCLLFIYIFLCFAVNVRHIEKDVENLQTKGPIKNGKYHFVLIAQELDNPYWRAVEQGVKAASAEYDVQVEYIAPLRTSVEEQVKLLEKAIASKVDGIVVQSLDEKTFAPIIDKAVAAHIPVVTIDTDAPMSQRAAYVGTDNYAAGEQLGEIVAEMTGGKGAVGVIIGSEEPLSQKLRLDGFVSVINKHPQMNIVDVLPSNISRIQATLQAESMLRKHPEISIMVGTSAMDAIGILNATKNLQINHIKIFGFDDVEETLRAVSDGSIQATIVQKPFYMGFQAIKILSSYWKRQEVELENYTPIEVITKTNVSLEEKN